MNGINSDKPQAKHGMQRNNRNFIQLKLYEI